MTKKYVLVIIAVLIILVVVVLAFVFYFSSKEESKQEEVQENQELIFYQNEEWGFELSYPADWQEKSTPQGQGMFSFGIGSPIEENSGGAAASFYLVAFEPEEGQIFENSIQTAIEQLETENLLISQKDEKISGLKAKELIYINKPENPDSKEIRYFIARENIWYQIFYTAKIDKFNQYLPAIEEIISTIKITK